ncbi:hypothetical protein FOL47_004287 [Perkinsus chesapeaki]|uniref:Uncharacterized protein n=1 Tax=Perkinsus chesapeaki TaxID=330153 RepID=A0A7J6M3L1_PERCH|nr:hypothetical protein FOL47_004287 [Perkinsus chesapeaki]
MSASEAAAQPQSVILFPECSLSGDNTTHGLLLIKAGLTPTEVDVCCLINNAKSESYTGRISTFNVIQGQSWDQFMQYLFTQVKESDVNLDVTEIADTKMVTLNIKDWVDYVHLYDGPVIDAAPYLIQAIEKGVVAGRTEKEVEEGLSQMDVLKRGAFRLAREKIRKAKQLEMILKVGKERQNGEADVDKKKEANYDRAEPLSYIQIHTPTTYPSGTGSYPLRKRPRAVIRKASKGLDYDDDRMCTEGENKRKSHC